MNAEKIVARDVTRFDARKNIFVADKKFVSVEKCFEIRVNGQPFRKIFCSPEDVEDLVAGLIAQAEKFSPAENFSRAEKKILRRKNFELRGQTFGRTVDDARQNQRHSQRRALRRRKNFARARRHQPPQRL